MTFLALFLIALFRVKSVNLAELANRVLRHRRQIWGHWVYVSALRLEDGKLLIVITNHRPRQAIADYGKR